MLTLRHAAELLRQAQSPDGRAAVARVLGFEGELFDTDSETRERLGLPEALADVQVMRGRGALRALLFRSQSTDSLRLVLAKAAGALSSHTIHVSWIIIGWGGCDEDVGIACTTLTTRGPRVAALVCDTRHIVSSDAEVVTALEAAREGDDALVYARWCDVLGREALSRRFYRTLEHRVRALGDSLPAGTVDERHELGLLCASRLLFLSFLEAKGWLDGNRRFLSSRFDAAMMTGRNFHHGVLLPLFFGTLNTPMARRSALARTFGAIPFLNGGLFARSALERRYAAGRFSNEAMGALFSDVLDKYRFTAREGHDAWTEAAIDPEMLGRAFESLMASRDRRMSGAFYTPQEIVAHLTERSLVTALAHESLDEAVVRRALAGRVLNPADCDALRARLRHFTVLDPACGSGAFLVHVLERLADLHLVAGDQRPLSSIRREIATRAIHGVDINPTAVWLCELRLWLSVVIESGETRMSAVPPLPNLDCNVRVGDALSGDAFETPLALVGPPAGLARLRERYVRATGPRKATLRRNLAREERRRSLALIDRELAGIADARRELLVAHRTADLFGETRGPNALERAAMRTRRLRAAALRRERRRIADGGALDFSFPSHFGAVHAHGGFDLVIGNPPWVRLHNIPLATRSALRTRFSVYRHAAWDAGSRGGHAAKGFASQVDLAALFVERSARLLAPTGALGLLLPSKLWRSLAGGGVRAFLAEDLNLREVADWSDAPSAFDAAVYPSLVVASRRPVSEPVVAGVRRRSLALEWTQAAGSIQLVPHDSASPWLVVPPDVRTAFNRIAERGTPFGQTDFGRAMLGVKCGCNDAFTVELKSAMAGSVAVARHGRMGEIERDFVRPLLRGDSVAPWRIPPSHDAIVWTHDEAGAALRSLPPGAARWLAPWRRQLSSRSDLRGSMRWWTLFRTEGADSSVARVVWSDFGRAPRAAVLAAGDPTVPLNSCYVVACPDDRDAFALTALMNSAIAAAWLNAIAEPARGGWRRYLAWTVSLLPIPVDWKRAREILAPLAERGIDGHAPSCEDLLDATCAAYRVRRHHIAPLLAWSHSATTT